MYSKVKNSEVLAELEALKGAKSMLEFQLAEAQTALEEKMKNFMRCSEDIEQSLGNNIH